MSKLDVYFDHGVLGTMNGENFEEVIEDGVDDLRRLEQEPGAFRTVEKGLYYVGYDNEHGKKWTEEA